MQVTFEGEEYSLDIENISFSEARYIFRQTGLTVKALLDGLQELHPEAAGALYWLMLKQSGQVKDINKLPDFPVIKLAEAVLAAGAADEDGDEEADPTEAALTANSA